MEIIHSLKALIGLKIEFPRNSPLECRSVEPHKRKFNLEQVILINFSQLVEAE